MTLEDFNSYVVSRGDSLVTIEPKFECGETVGTFYLVRSKETYIYGDEEEADAKINEARQLAGFESAKKTFKEGKVSKKTGEQISDDEWKVVVVIKY